jgi:hypothetical protein
MPSSETSRAAKGNIMSDIYSVKEKMHKMRAKLYPSYLQGSKGGYIARTTSEAALTIENICASMKNRGGYSGSYEDSLLTVCHFLLETLYQLADGFSVNLGSFSIHPNIGGIFNSDKEVHDHQKHPISFRFQGLSPCVNYATTSKPNFQAPATPP